MPVLGHAALLLGLVVAPFGAAASVYGARSGRPRWTVAGRRCVYVLFGVLTVAMLVLESAFVRSDFSFAVVASHSSTTTPAFYRVTAMWSSQEGSLLLWVWLLAGWSSAALLATRRRLPVIAPYAAAVLLGFATFFLGLAAFLADPFGRLSQPPAEGAGLEPLLRHPVMMIHPPTLYSGYTLWTIPFAFAVGALVTGRLDTAWSSATRRFALLAWTALGAGILLGARWSWSELGWGGYWAWDPVENAALLPWLTGTAFLHSIMVQEKRGLLKTWNVSLVLTTGVLAILGTFLVRSGILQSIHAFGGSTLGIPFLVFLALLSGGATVLVLYRREQLRSDGRLDSLASREAVFLLNNLVLVALAFVIFWGTFFPLISEAVTGRKAAVGPPWFDRYTVPLAIALVALSGIGPVMPWRRATRAGLRRGFTAPAVVAAAVVAALAISGVASRTAALALFAAAAFAVTAVAQELWRGGRARARVTGRPLPLALAGLVARNRRRYGGYLVHVGISVLLLGVAASTAFQHVRDVRLRPGQSASAGGYDFRYVRATGSARPDRVVLGAVLEVRRDGRLVDRLEPSRDYFPVADERLGPVGRFFAGEATSEVGLRGGLRRDLWTAVEPDLQGFTPMMDAMDRRFPLASGGASRLLLGAVAERYRLAPPPAAFRLIVAPLVAWVWLGGLVVLLGALLASCPAFGRRRVRARAAVPARPLPARRLERV